MTSGFKVFSEIQRRGHEQVVFFNYPEVGLRAVVGIHNTVLGPALGGCRMRPYESEDEAIDDALRLSEGMTYKSSLAGLDLGGGKACLIADPKMTKGRREMFLKFAECLNHLGGRYITAEDMGTSVNDIMTMREVSKYAAGFAREKGGSGDPSPFTAKGVFNSMQAACLKRFTDRSVKGRKIALQGVGHVGMYLLEHLVNAGAEVTICDTNQAVVDEAVKRFKVAVVEPGKIYDVKCDIFSPNAIGQTVNPDTMKRLQCPIICGGANNQLLNSSLYEMLDSKKMLYCPDFVVNAGGVISVGAEYVAGGWNEAWVTKKVEAIFDTTLRVLNEAEKRGKATETVALELARERVAAVSAKKLEMRGAA